MTQSIDSASSETKTFEGGTPWEGVLAVEGVPTGDGRMFSENAITWAEPGTMALRWNIEDSHGGTPTTKAVSVGRIDEVWRDGSNPLVIRGKGVFDDGPNSDNDYAKQASRRMKDNFLNGVSIDPDDIGDSDVELIFPEPKGDSEEDEMAMLFAAPEMMIFHAGRIRGATLVDIPAFVEARLRVADGEVTPVVAAGHFGAISDAPWSANVHAKRLPREMSVRMARSAFAHVETGSGDSPSARFLHHEIDESGEAGLANLTACAAGIRAINANRTGSMTIEDRRAAYGHMAQHLRDAGLTPPEYEGDEIVASVFAEKPPRAWFENPQLKTLTPLTVTDDGQIFGHGAAWGSCHMGFADTCVTPPNEPGGEHVYYRLGEVVTAEGDRIPVGTITLGTGHAPIRNITSSQAAEHYDNTGTAVALVASGEDEHGIWVAGAIRPGTPEARVVELRAASLSGDWRRIGGALRLVAFLAVNRPGFPVPRTAAFTSSKQQLSLVAAGVVSQDMRSVRRPDIEAAIQRIARSVGRDAESRIAAIRQRVGR